ncbi:MAG TPA: serine/threonine-protein kinase [Streptosporangiaceae bacterium]
MRVQDRTPKRLGPYRLIRRLGEGGMGVVYLATDSAQNQLAIKALHPGMAREENARRRMAREVDTMRRVHSRYVAEVVDADLDCDPPYIVTRYVPGMTLEDVVSAGGPVTGPALSRLGYGLAQALSAVHAGGVVHRDLKPGNVMIADGEPVVIDFGIAQLPENTRLTMTGMFMGTPGYLAPEVIEGRDSSAASDVHSWGATMAYAATGRPPYGTGPFETVFYRIMHGSPDLNMVPEPLRPVLLAARSRDPAYRPAADELGRRVAAIDPALLIPGPPATVARRPDGPAHPDARPAVALGALPQTTRDSDWPAWPGSTTPMDDRTESDLRDLLPPVTYAPPGGGRPNPGRPLPAAGAMPPPGPAGAWPGAQPGTPVPAVPPGGAPGQPGSPGRPGPPGRPDGQSSRTIGPVSPWSPLVIGTVLMAVAIAVMAPIIGTGIALAALVALRAVTITGRQVARRRAAEGGRAGTGFLAVAFYPVAAVRALLGLVLTAPVALLAFCIAAVITIIAVPLHPLPEAVAFGAGALIATVGLGPGSANGRTALASIYSSALRNVSLLVIAYAGVLAIALWMVGSAWTQAPAAAFWPVHGLHSQLAHVPTLHGLFGDMRRNLLSLARQFGL